jgi:Beta-galactosidase
LRAAVAMVALAAVLAGTGAVIAVTSVSRPAEDTGDRLDEEDDLSIGEHGGRGADLVFGVLGGTCDTDRLDDLRSAGVTVVEFDMSWELFEPAPGVVDSAYVADLRQRFAACREAGLRLVLSLGIQTPPAWAESLPSGQLLDRNGRPPRDGGGLDVVFSAAVREALVRYFDQVADEIGFEDVLAVRLGTSRSGELAYPGPSEGSSRGGHDFWAFNQAAQTGSGLAAGMEPTPLPGWVPGQRTWNGSPLTTEHVDSWFAWYTESLIRAVIWQADELRSLGFTGDFHVPTAGSGVFPSERQAAVEGYLDGRADPIGALERGLYYPEQFVALAELDTRLRMSTPDHGIAVDFTGLDDISAVRARRLSPPQDSCRPGDPERAAAGVDVEDWAAQRYTIALAQHYGLAVVGENPGPPDEPNTGGESDSDTVAEQLSRGIDYARECGVDLFMFAFERSLFSRTSDVDLEDYAREIERR